MKTVGKATDLITFSRSSGGTALRKISYGPDAAPLLSAYGIVGSGTWAASGSDYVFEDTVGSQVRPGVSWPTNGLSSGIYLVEINIASITGATQVRVDGIGATDQLIGAGESSFVIQVTSKSTPRIRIEDTSTSVGDGFALTSFSVKPVLFDQADGDLVVFNHPADIPRIEYDASGNVLGLLVEEARTNLVEYSEPDSRSSTNSTGEWSFSDLDPATEIANVLGPDGVSNSARSCSLASGVGFDAYVYQIPVTSGTSYTVSCYVKLGTATNFALHMNDTTAWDSVVDGYKTFTSSDGLNTETFERVSLTFVAPASNKVNIHMGRHSSGTQTQQDQGTVILYGFQLEAGAFPTSYIPTSGATATRSADVASIATSAFGYRQAEGAVVVVADTISTSANNHQDFRLTGSVSGNSVNSGSRVGSGSAGQYTTWIQGGGSTVALLTVSNAVNDGAQYKAAYRFAENDFALSVSGGSVVSDTAGAMPVSIGTLTLGYGYGYLNGHIKSIKYYPRRLTDAQLQELTT